MSISKHHSRLAKISSLSVALLFLTYASQANQGYVTVGASKQPKLFISAENIDAGVVLSPKLSSHSDEGYVSTSLGYSVSINEHFSAFGEAFSSAVESRDLEQIQKLPEPLFVAGKSMGGGVATTILESSKALGAIAYGYPFHPPGRPEKLRIEHFENMKKSLLIVQGTRDPFGKKEEKPQQWLPEHAQLTWLEDGEHSFKPRKSSGRTLEQNIGEAVEATVAFIDTVLSEVA